jgi:exopolysaccharide biosynthesis polyprenyl glycosylphosphotransferase
MKRLEIVFNILSIFLDAVAVVAAGSLAYYLRYRVAHLFPAYPVQFELSYAEFLRNIVIATPVLLIVLAFLGLYNLKSTRKFWPVILKIFGAVSTGLMLFVAVYFFNPQVFPSRLIVLMSWIFAIIAIIIARLVVLLVERGFLRRGIGLHKLVLITNAENDFDLRRQITSHPEYGYHLIKILTEENGLLPQLDELRREQGIDEIIQANGDLNKESNEALIKFTHDYGIKFNFVPSIIEAQHTNIAVTDVAGVPLIELKNTPLEGWGRVVKRVVDIVLSLLAIIIASPIFLVVSLIIKLDTSGKILFVQERFGQGKPFRFYKFRSMYQELSVGDEYGGDKALKVREELWKVNARQGPFLKIKNDPRVTRFGRFIRLTKLDELPQLFNVLRGDMSLVGPRAHVLDEVNRYKESHKRQFTIKPGITGLTQITQAKIPNLPFEEEIRLDTFYLENWSIILDLKIMWRTFLVLLYRPKKEYY